MTVLRVLAAAVPAEDHAESWALFDATGACVGSGRHPPAAWPRADRIEVVLAAALSRIAIVALPPMSASRVASAARFALEDQLAGPADAHHVAASAQTPDGRVRVAIASRALLSSIAEDIPKVARIVAESDLAAPSADWRWCAREAGMAGFVRRPDGSAFPVDAPSPTGALPAELQLALAQSRRGEATLPRVRVDVPVPETALARWSRESGVEFVRGTRECHRSPASLESRERPRHRRTRGTPLCAGARDRGRRACAPRARERGGLGLAAVARPPRRGCVDIARRGGGHCAGSRDLARRGTPGARAAVC
jgi:hypothetical protein